MDGVSKFPGILQRLDLVRSRLHHTEEDLKNNIAKLVAESNELFLIPELKKYPFRYIYFRCHDDV